MTSTIIDAYAYPLRGLDRLAAARYLGLSLQTFDVLMRAERLPRPRRLGDDVVWDRAVLDAAFEAFPVDGQFMPKRAAKVAMSEQAPDYHNVYTPTTLAERWKCSAQVIRNMIKRGDLPAHRYGEKMVRIMGADVAAHEASNTVKPRS